MSALESQSTERTEATKEPEPTTFAEFLEGVPPSQSVKVGDLWRFEGTNPALNTPQLQLHCTSNVCNGLRFFRCSDRTHYFNDEGGKTKVFVNYICSNCRKQTKLFSLLAVRGDLKIVGPGECYKFGEMPAFGPQTPARLIKLFGEDREVFLKGRRCENQGLGIGAFVYYRRVVESQKNRIIDEIIRVSKKIGAPVDAVAALEDAKSETQFAKAMGSVKDAIPQALLINGHNPLTLLHSALSGGLHAKSDEECLEFAHDTRVVLIELAERLGQALKDEHELNSAVSRLMKSRDS